MRYLIASYFYTYFSAAVATGPGRWAGTGSAGAHVQRPRRHKNGADCQRLEIAGRDFEELGLADEIFKIDAGIRFGEQVERDKIAVRIVTIPDAGSYRRRWQR
nr:hypothetical protein [uncultured Duganella sp.]